MISALILASHLNFHQVTIPPTFGAQTLVARSYGSRSSSYSRSSSSFSRPSSYSRSSSSAPTRIRIKNSTVQRVKPPTFNSFKKDSSGRIPLTKTAPPVIKANPPRNTIPVPRKTYQTPPSNYSDYSPAPVVIQQESTFGNPWFWMYMMDQNNNRPQVVQSAPVIQQPQENQSVATQSESVKTIVKEKPQNPLKTFLIFSLGIGGGVGLMVLLKNRNIIR